MESIRAFPLQFVAHIRFVSIATSGLRRDEALTLYVRLAGEEENFDRRRAESRKSWDFEFLYIAKWPQLFRSSAEGNYRYAGALESGRISLRSEWEY